MTTSYQKRPRDHVDIEPIGTERIGYEPLGWEGASRSKRLLQKPLHKQSEQLQPLDIGSSTTDLYSLNAKSSQPTSTSAAVADYRAKLQRNIAKRYSTGAATKPGFPDRPGLPPDTAEREFLYNNFPELRPYIEEKVPTFHGRDPVSLVPGSGSFPWSIGNAPDPVLYEDVPLFNGDNRRSFYGNYVGPSNDFGENEPPPLTPVDRAAWYHDREYRDIYDRYNYSEFEYGLSFTRELDRIFGTDLASNELAVGAFGWLGQVNSLDPVMQLELAWADIKIIGRSWFGIGEGLFSGFYSGSRGQKAFVTDLVWGTAITAFHVALIAWRLGVMVPLGVTYQLLRGATGLISNLGDAIGGDIGEFITEIGDLGSRLVVGAGQVVTGAANAVFAGTAYVAVKVVEGVTEVIEDIGDAVGCFISTAVISVADRANGEQDLALLRSFRDEFISSFPEGRRLIAEYSEVAPRIVRAIDLREDSQQVWRKVNEKYIDSALALIRSGRFHEAYALYRTMVRDLSDMVGTGLSFDGARYNLKKPTVVSSKIVRSI